MTVFHIITGLGGGGAEHMVLELAKQGMSNNVKTIIISVSNANKIGPKFKSIHAEYHFLGITSFTNIIRGLRQLNKIQAPHDTIVFHCHMFHACMLGIIFSTFYRKIPIVFTLHTNQVKQLLRRLILWCTKPLRRTDIIFSFNSKKWYLKNNAIIPNGIDTNKFFNDSTKVYNDDNPFRFLFLGRLYEPKNPLILVNLSNQLIKKDHVNFIIDVVGDGIMRHSLSDLIKLHNLENHILLHGFQSDVLPFLKKSNCMIMPSLWEGMPVSIIEAAATKLPVIATPVGSIPDFLNNNNATLSNLDNFHLAMVNAISDYKLLLDKSEKLYEEIKAVFDINNVYKKHYELYKSVL